MDEKLRNMRIRLMTRGMILKERMTWLAITCALGFLGLVIYLAGWREATGLSQTEWITLTTSLVATVGFVIRSMTKSSGNGGVR